MALLSSLRCRCRGLPASCGRAAAFRRLLLLRFLADALHVARLADKAGQAREAAALDTDLGQDLIDERRLHAVAQRRIDHLVGGAAAAAAAAAAVEPVHLQDADALDLLHRLDALAHDALDALE